MHKKTGSVEINSLAEIPLEGTDLILLDLDNTLYSYAPCHQKALDSLAKEISSNFAPDHDSVIDLYMECRKMINARHKGTAASHSRLFYIQAMVERLCGRTNVKLIHDLHELYWKVYFEEMELSDDATIFLGSIVAANIPVVVVTDMIADIQFKKMEKLQLQKYIRFIVSSEEAGVEKPHPLIFEMAINKALEANGTIKNVMVVGDDKIKDHYLSEKFNVTNYILRVH